MRRLTVYSSPSLKKTLEMNDQTIKICVWNSIAHFLVYFCIIEHSKERSGLKIDGWRESVVLWESGKNIQYYGRGEAKDKRSSCDCFGGGKRMLRMHVEEWYYKRLSGGFERASQANSRKIWFLFLATILTLPSPRPTLARCHLEYCFVSATTGGQKSMKRVNKIYCFKNYQRTQNSSFPTKKTLRKHGTCCVEEEIHLLCEVSVFWCNINRKILHSFTPWNVCWVLYGGWRSRHWIPVQWDIV